MLKFSLVIPCYNEAKNLPGLIERCAPLIEKGVEVILVDNGSKDETAAVFKTLPEGFTSVHIPENLGYGFGILEGLRAAKGDILGWTHADLQTDPRDFLRAMELFSDGQKNLFVKGRRSGRPLSDVVFTVGMSFFESFLLKNRFWDINAQPNVFSREFFQSWEQEAPMDFSLDLFVYWQARKQRLTLKRIPVHFGLREHGVSNWNYSWSGKKKFIERTIKFSLALRSKHR